LFKELLNEQNLKDELLAHYLVIILKKIKSSIKENEASIYQKFINTIDENLEHNYCANSYARLLGVDLKKLIAEVKQEVGRTPCTVITEQVIKKAQFYLLET
jgi:AraC-like DNA-binding protein